MIASDFVAFHENKNKQLLQDQSVAKEYVMMQNCFLVIALVKSTDTLSCTLQSLNDLSLVVLVCYGFAVTFVHRKCFVFSIQQHEPIIDEFISIALDGCKKKTYLLEIEEAEMKRMKRNEKKTNSTKINCITSSCFQ